MGTTGRVAVLALGLVSSGCAEASNPQEVNVVRDSAGVRIVETQSDTRFAASWILGETPIWAVGELEGDPNYLFDRVAGAAQMPDGSILIANGGSNQLRFYAEDGAFLRSLGREGQGPGEFEYLRALGPCREDGFVAFDLSWQMNAYTSDGSFVEKTIFRAPEGVTPYNLACDPQGHVLLTGWGRDSSAPPQLGFYQAHDRMLLTNHEGEIIVDFGERLISERLGSGGGSRPHPAGRATKFALHAGQVFVGSGEGFEVEVRDLDNTLLSLLRGPGIDLQVTEAIKSTYVEAELARASEGRRPGLRRAFADWEWPESFPAFVDLKVDLNGVVWLLAYNPEQDAPELWSIMDSSIGYLGDLAFPANHSLLEIGADYLLLLTTDDLDVERVVKVTLDRRTSVLASGRQS